MGGRIVFMNDKKSDDRGEIASIVANFQDTNETNETDMGEQKVSVAGDKKFIIEAEGFSGPLDLLLHLVRKQKIDISKISILSLAEQYFEYVANMKGYEIEQLADYIVMAAWLGYLKSRLLLPEEDDGEEHSAEEEAKLLAFHARRFAALMKCGERLFEREYAGRDFFFKGMDEDVSYIKKINYFGDQFHLFKAYGNISAKKIKPEELKIPHIDVITSHEVYEVLMELLEKIHNKKANNWIKLDNFIMGLFDELENKKSVLASSFVASLDMVKDGKIEIKQDGQFDELYLKPVYNGND